MRRLGLSPELNPERIVGRPDLALQARRTAVFVDGCFWHRCPIHWKAPRTNRAFWIRKAARNAERDRASTAALMAAGWRVVRVWEHEVREDPHGAALKVASAAGIRLPR